MLHYVKLHIGNIKRF